MSKSHILCPVKGCYKQHYRHPYPASQPQETKCKDCPCDNCIRFNASQSQECKLGYFSGYEWCTTHDRYWSLCQKPEKQECYCKYDKDGKQFGLCLRCLKLIFKAVNKQKTEKRKKPFAAKPYPFGFVKFQDGTVHNIEITEKGIYLDGVLYAKGHLQLLESNK